MLPSAVQGALRPSLELQWLRLNSNVPEDLTGATLTGTITRKRSSVTRAIVGDLTVTNGPEGRFTWDYDADDVEQAGLHFVQFEATFGSGQTPARTFKTEWTVEPNYAVSS